MLYRLPLRDQWPKQDARLTDLVGQRVATVTVIQRVVAQTDLAEPHGATAMAIQPDVRLTDLEGQRVAAVTAIQRVAVQTDLVEPYGATATAIQHGAVQTGLAALSAIN